MKQTKQPALASAPRGYIVADTGALLALFAHLPSSMLTESAQIIGKPVCLADGLFMLVEQGYQIIIPEMVAIECGHYMRDGQTLDQYFEHFSEWTRHSAPFMAKLRRQPEPAAIRIEPPAPDDTSKAAACVRQYWNIHISKADVHTKRSWIVAADKRYKHEPDGGEIAACQLMAELKDAKAPVFFLSDDVAAETFFAQHCPHTPINKLGSMGFYRALAQSGQAAELGISADQIELAEHLEQQLTSIGIAKTLNTAAAFKDRAMTAAPDSRERPFVNEMNALKQSRQKQTALETPIATVSAHTTEGTISQLDKFRNRYNKR